MNNIWDDRYSLKEYFYGEEPNVFFAEQLGKLNPGTIILPCEGEGRNAVYAASQGWKAKAFDSSEAGRRKALLLAGKHKQHIDYIVEDALLISFPKNSVDVVAFIYAHFAPATRAFVHEKAISWLKPGGKIILEAFNPGQLNNNSGGPKDLSMLYTEEMLRNDFVGLKIELLETKEITLHEGKYHEGKADIIRFVGIKI